MQHYDKLGVLSPTIVDDNGYWYYSSQDLDRLQLIKNLQTMGFSLKEIKSHLDTNCEMLRDQLCEKMSYINEQLLQLEMAKRLIKKIEIRSELSVYDAINVSIDEEHMIWYKENLPEEQYLLVEEMMRQPESIADHDKLVKILKSTKPLIKKKANNQLCEKIKSISDSFKKYGLSDNTIKLLMESFMKSNLEGPLSLRILNVKEVIYLLDLM